MVSVNRVLINTFNMKKRNVSLVFFFFINHTAHQIINGKRKGIVYTLWDVTRLNYELTERARSSINASISFRTSLKPFSSFRHH